MADTIREAIIKALDAGLEGYTFTALSGVSIHRGLLIFDPDVTPPPLISIIPRPESSEQALYGGDEKTMQLDFSCIVTLGADDNPSVLGEVVLGELIQSVFSIEPGNVQNIIYRSGGVDEYPDGSGQDTITVGMSVDVIYATDFGDPYTAIS